MNLAEIRNYVQLSNRLGTAGQPSVAQMQLVAAAGYEVVINLDVPNSRFAIADEAGIVASMGMTYFNIPVDFMSPAMVDLHLFVETMDNNAAKMVFVHCAANYRVSTFMALYAQLRWGWSVAEADAHIHRLWEPNEIWVAFINAARHELTISENTTPG